MAVSPGIALNTVFLLVDLAFNEALGTGGGGGGACLSSCARLRFCGALAGREALFTAVMTSTRSKISTTESAATEEGQTRRSKMTRRSDRRLEQMGSLTVLTRRNFLEKESGLLLRL